MNHIVGKLALDSDLAGQALVYTAQQFAESPALPKAFTKALLRLRQETPDFIDDLFGDPGLQGELGRALPAMLYEFLRRGEQKGSCDGGRRVEVGPQHRFWESNATRTLLSSALHQATQIA